MSQEEYWGDYDDCVVVQRTAEGKYETTWQGASFDENEWHCLSHVSETPPEEPLDILYDQLRDDGYPIPEDVGVYRDF